MSSESLTHTVVYVFGLTGVVKKRRCLLKVVAVIVGCAFFGLL